MAAPNLRNKICHFITTSEEKIIALLRSNLLHQYYVNRTSNKIVQLKLIVSLSIKLFSFSFFSYFNYPIQKVQY